MYDPFQIFDYRAQLTSRLILKFKHISKEQKERILLLLKSDMYEDLVLAEEIMNVLAI